MIDIHQLLYTSTISVGLPGTDKDEVIRGLMDLVERHPNMIDRAAAERAVFDREGVMSTGVGKGLGLPHAKTRAVGGTIAAFAITAKPVDFNAIDGRPVRLLFLLLGTDEARSQHIKLLSRVSRLMNRDTVRARLLKAQSPEEVLRIFAEGEAQLP